MSMVISSYSLASITRFSLAEDSTSFKISGYILDSNGHGVASAMIIFNVPQIVPAVYSDASGYYVISAPAGTYHINVWPPFDSNYIHYDEQSFVVGSDITKNITLNSGYKISGYISDSSGKPVKDAIVSLNNYLSGWFSKDTGYYFVSAPAGTYKLSVTPRSGYNHFPSYYESNFVVNGNLAKNITVGSLPTPASNTLNVELQPKLDGKALFTNEKVHTSPKSVRLIIPKNASQGSYAMALYPYNGTLNSISSFSIFASCTHAVPRFMLCLEKNGHGWADTFLLSDYQFASNGEWKATTGGNRWGWTETNIQLTSYGSTWNTIDFWVTKYGNLTVLYIGILLEYWAVDPDGFGEPLYADELILNGVTYNIKPATGSPSPSPSPTPSPAPVNAMPTQLTISTDASSPIVGSVVNVNGRLSCANGTSLQGKPIILSYAVGGNFTWVPIGSGTTDSAGEYSIQWANTASGTFTLKAEWNGNYDYLGVSATTTLIFLPYENHQDFILESNSTVSALAFDSTSLELSFTVDGTSGTAGYVKIIIAKSIVANAENMKVYFDGNQLNYEVTSTSDSWLLTFTYMHSTHQVSINLATNNSATTLPGLEYWTWIVVAISIVVIGTSLLLYFKKRKHKL